MCSCHRKKVLRSDGALPTCSTNGEPLLPDNLSSAFQINKLTIYAPNVQRSQRGIECQVVKRLSMDSVSEVLMHGAVSPPLCSLLHLSVYYPLLLPLILIYLQPYLLFGTPPDHLKLAALCTLLNDSVSELRSWGRWCGWRKLISFVFIIERGSAYHYTHELRLGTTYIPHAKLGSFS